MSTSPNSQNPADDPEDRRISGENGATADGQRGEGRVGSVLIPERFLPSLSHGTDGVAPASGDPEALDLEALDPEAVVASAERAAIARGQVVAQWLGQIERKDAPFSLEGLVVAAMNPGHRQMRAAASLAGLTRLEVPSGLEGLVARNVFNTEPSETERAPEALDHLVHDRVEDPEAGLVQGMARRLGPVQAPKELQARVEFQLESGLYAKPERGRSWLRIATVGVALAAGVLFVSRVGQLVPTHNEGPAAVEVASSDVRTTASGLPFTVTYVDSDSMSASDRNVLKAIGLPGTGGS